MCLCDIWQLVCVDPCRSEASGNGRDDGKSLVVPVRHAAGGLELTRNQADQHASSTSEQEVSASMSQALL